MSCRSGRRCAEKPRERIAHCLSLVLNIVLIVGILIFGAIKVAPKVGGGGGMIIAPITITTISLLSLIKSFESTKPISALSAIA
ncbi:hypothetical protein C1869_14915 [Eggerthella lenta]|nr:hypothetical protein C1869_14915 [Eggerthella lenta]